MENQEQLGRDEIATLVISTLHEVLSHKDEFPQDPLEESTCLIGRKAVLSSIDLVTLVVELEQRLEDKYGVSLVLTDDQDMMRRDSPFQTVKSLTDRIVVLIGEERLSD